MQKKHILIVFKEAFCTGWMGSTNRIFHVARVLQTEGYRVTLLAGKYTNIKVQKQLDSEFPGSVYRTLHSGNYPRLIDNTMITRRLWRVILKLLGKELYFLNLSLGWAISLDYKNVLNNIIKKNGEIDIVWGICGGYIDSLFAANSISEELKIRNILEMHDPPWHSGLLDEYICITLIYNSLLKNAMSIVVNSQSYYNEIINKLKCEKERIKIIPQVMGENLSDSEWKNEKFVMTYVGLLSKDRNLESVLLSMAEIKQKMRNNFPMILKIYGNGANIKQTLRKAKELHIENYVFYKGYVEHNSIVKILEQSELNILIQSQAASLFEVPGKLFEYLTSKKKVLGIMMRCETSQIIERANIGKVFIYEDVKGISEYLEICIESWKKEDNKPHINEEYIERFKYLHFSEEIHKLMLKI